MYAHYVHIQYSKTIALQYIGIKILIISTDETAINSYARLLAACSNVYSVTGYPTTGGMVQGADYKWSACSCQTQVGTTAVYITCVGGTGSNPQVGAIALLDWIPEDFVLSDKVLRIA